MIVSNPNRNKILLAFKTSGNDKQKPLGNQILLKKQKNIYSQIAEYLDTKVRHH